MLYILQGSFCPCVYVTFAHLRKQTVLATSLVLHVFVFSFFFFFLEKGMLLPAELLTF